MLSAASSDVRLQETFDSTGGFTTSTPFNSDGANEYFGIADGNGDGGANFGAGAAPSGLRAYTGLDDNFLTGANFDDVFPVKPVTITWSGVNIAGLSNIAFSADFAEFTGETSTANQGSSIIVSAQIDGGGFQPFLSFRGDNGVFLQDTDLDGIGDGAQLTTAAQTFGLSIPGTGSTLDLRISFDIEPSGQDFAIDDVCIGEAPILVAGDDSYSTPQDTELVTTADTGVLANDSIMLFHESFEGDPGTTYTLEDPFDDGALDFFNRYMVPDNTNTARDDFQTGFDGMFAIMGQDHDGQGGEATRTIGIPGINIIGADNLQVSVSLGALNNEPEFNEYEAADGDGIQIFAIIDGGSPMLIAQFAPPSTGSGDLYLDTNGDGVGDVSDANRLTRALKEFTFDVPGSGSSLDLAIDLTSTNSIEPLVVDNVHVSAGNFQVAGGMATAENASAPTAGGTFMLNPDGSFTYTPPMGFNGIDTFTYDFTFLSFTQTATVTIEVGDISQRTDVFLNEVVTTPDGMDNPNEYIEIRGTADSPLPGTFLLIVEGEEGAPASQGEIVNLVDLRFSSIGSGGFLAIVDAANHPYPIAAGTTIVDVPGMDFDDGSFTAFLVFVDPETGMEPVVGQDLDMGDDGLDMLPTGWSTIDGVSVLDGHANDRGYAAIVFSSNGDGVSEMGAILVDAGFGADAINQVMRIGDSTGSMAADWVAFDHDPVSSAPGFTIAQSSDPAYAFGQVVTGDVGATNPVSAASTAVFIDNGDAGYTSTGFHTIPDAIFTTPEGRDGDNENAPLGNGARTATWTFMGLTAGTYRVSATWPSFSNRATNSPFSIFDGDTMGSLLQQTLVNQQLEPGDFTDDGSAWEDLGIVTITGSTLTVQLSDLANGFVIADAMRLDAFPTEPAPGAMFIDDGDDGYADTGWNISPLLEGRLNDIRYQSAGDGSQTATWTFTGLAPGNYTVAATWSAHPNRAADAPYSIFDGSGGPLLEIMQVNQQMAPDDFSDNGSNWEQLTIVTITGTELVVELSNDARGFVIADAIRIEPTTDAPLTPGTIIDNGDADFMTTAGWFESLTEGRDGDVHYTGPGDGSRIATWTFTGLTAGMYRVSATWSTNANRATDAPYTIFDGMTALGTVDVNQQLAPDDFSTLGSDWEDLMTVQITGDTLVVELSNDANGFVIADAIRIQPVVM